MTNKTTTIIIAMLLSIMPISTFADVLIIDVMCNPVGKDSDGEWVKLQNTSSESVDLTGWKFNDGKNHILNAPPKNGSKGSLTIASGEAVLLANKADKVSTASSISTIIDTVMSLSNKGEVLQLINSDGIVVHEVSYSESDVSEGESCFNYDSSSNATSTGSSTTTTSSTSTQESTVTGSTTTEPVIIYNPIVTTVIATTTRIETQLVRHNIITSVHKTKEYSFETIKIEPAPALNTRLIAPVVALIDTPVHIYSESYNAIGRQVQPVCNLNFGDGTNESTCDTKHTYELAGEYAIKLSTKSDRLRAELGTRIRIINPDLELSTVQYDNDDDNLAIVINNNSTDTLELNSFELEWGSHTFVIPDETIILANGSIKLTEQVLGHTIKSDDELHLYSEHKQINITRVGAEAINDAKILEQITELQAKVTTLKERLAIVQAQTTKPQVLARVIPSAITKQKSKVKIANKISTISKPSKNLTKVKPQTDVNVQADTVQLLKPQRAVVNKQGIFSQLFSYIGL